MNRIVITNTKAVELVNKFVNDKDLNAFFLNGFMLPRQNFASSKLNDDEQIQYLIERAEFQVKFLMDKDLCFGIGENGKIVYLTLNDMKKSNDERAKSMYNKVLSDVKNIKKMIVELKKL